MPESADSGDWPAPDPMSTLHMSQAIDTSTETRPVSLPTRRALTTLRAELGELLSDINRALPITRPARLEDHPEGELRVWRDDPRFISVHTLVGDEHPPCAYLRIGELASAFDREDWKPLTSDDARQLAYALLAAAKDAEALSGAVDDAERVEDGRHE